MQQNVNEVIDHLASKLSVPTAHLWDVLVRQQRIDVVQWAAFTAVTTVFALWARTVAKKAMAREYGWNPEEVFPVLVAVAMCAVSLVWGIVAAGELVNPEYYALKEILSALKP